MTVFSTKHGAHGGAHPTCAAAVRAFSERLKAINENNKWRMLTASVLLESALLQI
jgi:hypothetical protein